MLEHPLIDQIKNRTAANGSGCRQICLPKKNYDAIIANHSLQKMDKCIKLLKISIKFDKNLKCACGKTSIYEEKRDYSINIL